MSKRKILLVVGLPFAFLFYFTIAMYLVGMNTGLPGRKGGPQDAFRHTYSSALVSKYISPSAVLLYTKITERYETPHDQMDRHNNKLGARLGPKSSNIYDDVMASVRRGQINAADPSTTTWLPENMWTDGF